MNAFLQQLCVHVVSRNSKYILFRPENIHTYTCTSRRTTLSFIWSCCFFILFSLGFIYGTSTGKYACMCEGIGCVAAAAAALVGWLDDVLVVLSVLVLLSFCCITIVCCLFSIAQGVACLLIVCVSKCAFVCMCNYFMLFMFRFCWTC